MSRIIVQPKWFYNDGVNKFGRNTDVDANSSTETDIVRQDGLQHWPGAAVAAANIDLFSSSIEDDPDKDPGAGTGAHTTWIEGLDDNGLWQTEEVANNGTADTQPANDYWRIFRAYVGTVGTGLTNAGNLTIDDGTNVLAYIAAGESQTQAAVYTVPADYREARLLHWACSVGSQTAASVDFAIWIRENSSVGVSTTAWRQIDHISIGDGVTHDRTFPFPRSLDPLTDIRIAAIDATVANLLCTAMFTLELIN